MVQKNSQVVKPMGKDIRRFRESDYKTILKWHIDHKVKCPPLKILPEVGIIVDEVAAGFIYVVEKKVAWIDFYITNPRSDLRERNKWLDEITRALLVYAKLCDVIIVVTNSRIPAVISRAKAHGFEPSKNVTMLYRGV